MFLVGEALIGEAPELAHVDLIIGEKDGAAGTAFATGMAQLSAGHTPLLSVIRPNLLTKPATLIVPKVTVKSMDQASQIFGPAQNAVALAVADSVESGVIPRERVEELVVVVSVFIHPDARDYSKIYRYNYGATRLALERAMEGFPDIKTVIDEKDRAAHPIMGFKVTRLWDPPYLQVAIDIPDIGYVQRILREIPESDHLIIEAGTPLIKRYGVNVVERIREVRPNAFIVADLKTLDTGNLEARMVADATADAVVISGLAPTSTIEKAIREAKKTGIYSVIDMLNVKDPVELLKELAIKPEVVELHRAIDLENTGALGLDVISEIKELSKGILVAVAGGVRVDKLSPTDQTIDEALKAGADIIVVGRDITKSKDVRLKTEQFLERMKKPEIDQYRVMTDF
ncbi:Bifunctional enzyme Fae/Hps [Candidatus Methanoperedenaceae archaeon GB50]|nr:MAG: Bifunctional enzyme Fae/Hps [Candidatus Methanoperedenaceae archaeon GB50]CAD7776518.1 Bifunctional enzyme Fae/Hps [Candidatus Methanoperedenaceae archaeon GB37]CAD7776695.1 Bifunctional enzyme Fae/Hps [Candidatus Methanoperedenaceae archaeon GB50]